jgi:hypothetical protein
MFSCFLIHPLGMEGAVPLAPQSIAKPVGTTLGMHLTHDGRSTVYQNE